MKLAEFISITGQTEKLVNFESDVRKLKFYIKKINKNPKIKNENYRQILHKYGIDGQYLKEKYN